MPALRKSDAASTPAPTTSATTSATSDSAAASGVAAAGSAGEVEMMRLVAELYYLRERSQLEIAALTGFSVSTVSRLLAAARSRGIVQISVAGAPLASSPLATELGAALGLEVHLTPGRETDPPIAARLCGVAAASRIGAALPQQGVLGLTGGYTVEALVSALPEERRPELLVVPLVGGWDTSNPHLNSNEIARRLAERLGASVRLLHAPGLLDSEATTRALLADSAITSTTRYWGSLELAVVGMSGGPVQRPGYGTVMDRLDEAGRSRLQDKGAVGDVAGHLVRLDGSFVEDEWERRTISIPLAALRRAARVVGIAAGSNKVESIIGGARTGLLHLLVTDEPTARAALARLEGGA